MPPHRRLLAVPRRLGRRQPLVHKLPGVRQRHLEPVFAQLISLRLSQREPPAKIRRLQSFEHLPGLWHLLKW